MRPKSDNAPYHCHDCTPRDPIQGVFCPREQRPKAERKPERRQQREATGSRQHCHEGTECSPFVEQRLHDRLLLRTPRFLHSCGLAPECVSDETKTEDKHREDHVIHNWLRVLKMALTYCRI